MFQDFGHQFIFELIDGKFDAFVEDIVVSLRIGDTGPWIDVLFVALVAVVVAAIISS